MVPMTRVVALPLGVDIGSTRLRIAAAQRSSKGEVRLTAVATRDLPEGAASPETLHHVDLLAAVIEDVRRELGGKERRCVLSLGPSVAALRVVRFPKMSAGERTRAARFEAERFAAWDVSSVASVVRVHPVLAGEGLHAVGLAKRDALDARLACARNAGLRPVGVDYDACAMRRAFPFADAVLDVGHRRAVLHAFSAAGPASVRVESGGEDVTRAIGSDLSIDPKIAEKRKRILGTAGAGEGARDAFVRQVADAVANVRERISIRRIALTGNGARLAGLGAALETATNAIVEMPVSDVLREGEYPDDVVRAAAPDWTLAACLCGWSVAT
jgi:Tfp pilus assembly PilM family ATPase